MALIVAKFGGTSLASGDHIIAAAQRIADEISHGNQVVVVVSAMAGETNRLIKMAQSFSDQASLREIDMVLASGEQVACGLMAIALGSLGLKAQSCLGWQVPIITTEHFSKARLIKVEKAKLEMLISDGIIPVIAGFQGVTEKGEITTFGRGGSDLTAVAIAAALEADYCMLFKDVEGIYSADPRVVEKAQLINELTFEEMLELASLGAKVVQPRAVESALIFDVDLHIKPSLSPGKGTKIVQDRTVKEQELVLGVVCNRGETKICLKETPVSPSVAARLFGALADADISVDMIIQNGLLEGQEMDDLTFTVSQEDACKALDVANDLMDELDYKKIIVSDRVAKISVVGAGMRGHASVAHKVFETLAEHGISVHGVSTSEMKISILVSADYAELALCSLHNVFGLDKKDYYDDRWQATVA